MAIYFPERREVGSFTIPLESGKASLTCSIFEHWQDTDNTTTARCGDPGTIEVKKVVGMTIRDEQTLKTSIEGTIGAEGLAQVKSNIESSLKHEISFQTEVTTSKVSNFSSPPCGRKTMFVYQLVREYEFSYFRRKWGFTKSWERKIRDKTNIHDFMPDIDEYDESCNCKHPPQSENFDGMVIMDMGSVSIRAPYRRIGDGIEVKLDTSTLLKISIHNSEDFLVKIPIKALPDIVVFLGDLTEESVEAAFFEYKQPTHELGAKVENAIHDARASIENWPAVEILQVTQNLDAEI